MFTITNLETINEEANRKTGNKVVTEVSNYIKNSISDEYLFVRYMGPKFIIFFSGIDSESVTGFIQELKTEIEKMQIKIVGENETNNKKKSSKNDFVTPL